jgi:transcriptional regulator with XRE-family HTH domain
MEWYKKIKFARKVSGLTIREVSDKVGITNSYYSQIETGQIKNPSFFKMLKIMKLFNLTNSDFIEKYQEHL